MLHALSHDPYGIFGVVLTPTRELAKQIVEQIMALGAGLRVKAALVVGGMDMVRQACELSRKPHFVVATPGRLAALLRGPNPPALRNVRYVVLDEADRLLAGSKSGFERDVAEVLLHSTTTGGGDDGEKRVRRARCQTLMFSATLTRSLASLEEMAGAGLGRLPLQKFVIRDDETGGGGAAKKDKKRGREEAEDGDNGLDGSSSTSPGDDLDDDDGGGESSSSAAVEDETSIPRIPAGLRQEYVFMPSKVRDAYLLTAIRTVMANGGRRGEGRGGNRPDSSGWNDSRRGDDSEDDDETTTKKARSAIVFVSTCERAALVSGILTELGISNVALHSLLSQNRRLASLAKFKSQQSRVLVATDVASRGLDIPTVDLVLNAELPRRAVDYVHRVGRTARAGRRGRAISLVGERDVALVHAAEKLCGRGMEKCPEVTDDAAVRLLGSVAKAARLARMKLMDVGFDDLVKRMKERKARDRRERSKAERAARRVAKKARSAASS
uniref:RNA helicase n=2 Tax=Odontella aurita TaxID=265563 RepID=A0A7S4N8P5_9STRA|mmetsp:Transcript_52102/g.156368  ORF Transcript_52102/g.156368 Transcript_52102/m.156368 type:complete len:498 (+) Transcript_52102:341-1834(+)